VDVLQGNEPIPLEPFDVIRVFSRYEIDSPQVTINGEVLRPGEYPLAKGMTVTALINMAGGFKRSAYRAIADLATYTVQNQAKALISTRTVELATALQGDKAADVELKPGDVLSVRQITGWRDIGSSMTVDGEVGHPGVYGLMVNERLSSVLERAGGIRETGFPQAAILERVQVRELGEKARMDLIQQIESEDMTAMVGTGTGTAQEQMETLQSIHQQQQQALTALRTHPATGRLVIDISGDVSTWKNTQADIQMRDGDVLMIPKEAAFVLVSGQVYSPSALTYLPGKTANWYLNLAGNITKMGNKKDIFIVRANGSVIGRRGLFKDSVLSAPMYPGDSVVVPEKIFGPPLWKSLVSIAQMMSSVSLTAVAGGL
jgi:protein involved in polysaccharide export with SLBB domain